MARVAAYTLGGMIFLLAAGFGFGISGGDVRAMRDFGDAVARWQINPEFRAVQGEYVRLGVAAMRGKLCGVPAGNVVMGFRSLPGLPESLHVAPTSAAHYDAFSRGDLSAYLHLSGEQGVADGIASIESLARSPTVDDERVREFLRGFKLPVPIATDAGAVASVQVLLADARPAEPITIRSPVRPLLGPHFAAIASSIGAPTDPKQMTFRQQQLVFARLDDYVKTNDPQLWRTKQISDFLAGIWAQGYGQIYLAGIIWAMRLRLIGRVIVIATLAAGAIRLSLRRRRLAPETAVAISHHS